MAAGSCTTTETIHGSMKKVVFAWTAGTAPSHTGLVSDTTTHAYDGQIIGFTTIPATAGDQPDDNYDVTLTDANSHDVLLGAGANRDETNTEHVTATSMSGVAGSPLTLNVTNAGAGLKGTAIVWIR